MCSIILLIEGRTRIGIQDKIYQALESVPLSLHWIVSQLILIKVAHTGNTHTHTIVKVLFTYSLHIANNMGQCAGSNEGGKVCC